MESARIVAGVARVVRDVGLAEDLAHDALIAAMDQWPRRGCPDNPGAWLAATARRRAIDTIRREQNLARKTEQLSTRRRATVGARGRRGGGRRDAGDRRRAPRAAVRHLPSGARPGVAGRADPAAVRGPDHRRGRAGAARGVADGRAADLARQEEARRRGPARARGAGRRRAHAASGSVLEVDLPRVQRGLRGQLRRPLDPPGPVRGGDAAGARAGAAAARRGRGPRPGRADGAAGLPAARPHGAGRAAGAARRPGPGALGPAAARARARGAGRGRGARASTRGRTRCRPRSPPAMPARAPPTTPTGRGWRRCTASSAGSPRRPSSSSTAPSSCPAPRARPPGSPSSTRWPTPRSSPGYHLLPAVRADLLEQLGRLEEADRELARAMELARTGAERELLARRREALHAR